MLRLVIAHTHISHGVWLNRHEDKRPMEGLRILAYSESQDDPVTHVMDVIMVQGPYIRRLGALADWLRQFASCFLIGLLIDWPHSLIGWANKLIGWSFLLLWGRPELRA